MSFTLKKIIPDGNSDIGQNESIILQGSPYYYLKWYNLKINYSKLMMNTVNPIVTINKIKRYGK